MITIMPGPHGGILFVEMVGLTLSMVSLILSLFIFCHFRNLWSTQTRLRKNLFIALGIHIIVRLIIALSDSIRLAASTLASNSNHLPGELEFGSGTEFLRLSGGINHKIIPDCETFLPAFILEYTRNAMFLWMFLEGLYLHSMITAFPIIQERLNLKFYYLMGWAAPIGLTFIWVMMAAEKVNGNMCWKNDMFTSYFWILEGPKLTIILMTIFFLLNVIRILVTKLWRSCSPEVNQIRKAVSRSIVLVPLLGITNYLHLQMRHSPLQNGFTSWAYSTAFITSFQGVFAALIYCFLHGEVQATLRRWYTERRNEQREIIMVNGGPAGNCAISSTINHNSESPDSDRDSTNNNGAKSGSIGLVSFFGWGKQKRETESSQSRNEETPADQLKLADNGNADDDHDTASVGQESLSQQSSLVHDPYSKEHWNEVDLSAHCNVDIEHIEIPIEYFHKYNAKQQQQLHATTNDTCPNRDSDSRRSSAFLMELDDDFKSIGDEDSCTSELKCCNGDKTDQNPLETINA